jgi:hypothetical protein
MTNNGKKGRFYAHGRFFEDEREFFQFLNNWPDMPWDRLEFKAQMQMRLDELEMNDIIRGGKLTNREAYEILRLCTNWAVNEDK